MFFWHFYCDYQYNFYMLSMPENAPQITRRKTIVLCTPFNPYHILLVWENTPLKSSLRAPETCLNWVRSRFSNSSIRNPKNPPKQPACRLMWKCCRCNYDRGLLLIEERLVMIAERGRDYYWFQMDWLRRGCEDFFKDYHRGTDSRGTDWGETITGSREAVITSTKCR